MRSDSGSLRRSGSRARSVTAHRGCARRSGEAGQRRFPPPGRRARPRLNPRRTSPDRRSRSRAVALNYAAIAVWGPRSAPR
ncbi:hypothetical protein [Lysobacter gummosus]|uniref:hypothetical protein n=1 Tax=Lysobacter gummosus TaxID=262324 RepID=UPI003641BCFA